MFPPRKRATCFPLTTTTSGSTSGTCGGYSSAAYSGSTDNSPCGPVNDRLRAPPTDCSDSESRRSLQSDCVFSMPASSGNTPESGKRLSFGPATGGDCSPSSSGVGSDKDHGYVSGDQLPITGTQNTVRMDLRVNTNKTRHHSLSETPM